MRFFTIYKCYIAVEEHGFFIGRSTLSNLVVFQTFLMFNVENDCQVDAIYADASKKDFDTIPMPC